MITKCLNRTALQQLENQSYNFCSRTQLIEKALERMPYVLTS
jgi:hypothetical protein